MSQVSSLNQSTWTSKLKAMGPGILMASGGITYRIFYSSWWFLWLVSTTLGHIS